MVNCRRRSDPHLRPSKRATRLRRYHHTLPQHPTTPPHQHARVLKPWKEFPILARREPWFYVTDRPQHRTHNSISARSGRLYGEANVVKMVKCSFGKAQFSAPQVQAQF